MDGAPGDSDNVGESITIDVPKLAIDKIGICNGFCKDEGSFGDYSRVKKVRVEVEGPDGADLKPLPDSREVEFEDTFGMQVVDIEDLAGGRQGGKVKLTVLEVHEGTDYTSFAVSELLLYLNEFDVPAKATGTSNDDEMVGLEMLDDSQQDCLEGTSRPASPSPQRASSLSSVSIQSADKAYDRPKKVELSVSGDPRPGVSPDTTDLSDHHSRDGRLHRQRLGSHRAQGPRDHPGSRSAARFRHQRAEGQGQQSRTASSGRKPAWSPLSASAKAS